jgi:hypothetical protein
MKYYCYNNNVEIYNKQPLLQYSTIINVLNPSQNEIEFVIDFVKNNSEQCKKNSYITLVKGTRKKFIKNDKSKRKIKMLEHAPKPLFFYTPSNESTPIEPTPIEPTTTESTPIEPTTTESTPIEPTTTESTPIEPTTTESTPIEPTPIEPIIIEANNYYECKECDIIMYQFKKQVGCLIDIKQGEKLYIDNDILCIDKSYGFNRMIKNMFWPGYNRNNIISKLEEIFNIDFTKVMHNNREYLIKIKKGLTNLLETYINDDTVKSRLCKIINKLD